MLRWFHILSTGNSVLYWDYVVSYISSLHMWKLALWVVGRTNITGDSVLCCYYVVLYVSTLSIWKLAKLALGFVDVEGSYGYWLWIWKVIVVPVCIHCCLGAGSVPVCIHCSCLGSGFGLCGLWEIREFV